MKPLPTETLTSPPTAVGDAVWLQVLAAVDLTYAEMVRHQERPIVGPFNRVEGDLEVHLDIAEGAVASARVPAPLYRGFELMLEGRDPRVALVIAPRTCGICSISQSSAAARALASASNPDSPPQGAAMAALLHAVENTADHLTHFNLFFMPDFTRPAYAGRRGHDRAVARFAAMSGAAQRATIAARAELLHIVGLMAGKWPHPLAIQPGGVTRRPGPGEKMRILASLRGFRHHLERVVFGGRLVEFAALATLPELRRWERGDVALFLEIAEDLALAQLGRGAGRYLSFGAYPLTEGRALAAGVLWQAGTLAPLGMGGLREDLSHAWMLGPAAHPGAGSMQPDTDMREPAYSGCKAPPLNGQPVEGGALARQVIDGHPLARALAGDGGVLARVGARLLAIARGQLLMETLAEAIDPAGSFMSHAETPRQARSVGLVEAARGALGHWLDIRDGRIAGYQIIGPTTWNLSPRESDGTPGPLEAALVGTPVLPGEQTPVAVQHVVRSFDPCMVCTVH